MPVRIGSVPYLNARPQVEYFDSAERPDGIELVYAPPSRLAAMLEAGELDVANVSSFEIFRNPGLRIVPGSSISATGPVKSVRLFHRAPLAATRSVALDNSSLTSAALIRILLSEQFRLCPEYVQHAPDLDAMLSSFDAGLLIGDLKLFELMPGVQVYDLGQGWFDLTGLPFVYALWLAREDAAGPELTGLLDRALAWGLERREEIAVNWARRLELPVERCRDYLFHVMDYRLEARHLQGLELFRRKCVEHGLVAPAGS